MKNTKQVNPLLIVMLLLMAVFPFVVSFLPVPVVQYFDLLFR